MKSLEAARTTSHRPLLAWRPGFFSTPASPPARGPEVLLAGFCGNNGLLGPLEVPGDSESFIIG